MKARLRARQAVFKYLSNSESDDPRPEDGTDLNDSVACLTLMTVPVDDVRPEEDSAELPQLISNFSRFTSEFRLATEKQRPRRQAYDQSVINQESEQEPTDSLKLAGSVERIYRIAEPFIYVFNHQSAALRSWQDKGRTATLAGLYFALWSLGWLHKGVLLFLALSLWSPSNVAAVLVPQKVLPEPPDPLSYEAIEDRARALADSLVLVNDMALHQPADRQQEGDPNHLSSQPRHLAAGWATLTGQGRKQKSFGQMAGPLLHKYGQPLQASMGGTADSLERLRNLFARRLATLPRPVPFETRAPMAIGCLLLALLPFSLLVRGLTLIFGIWYFFGQLLPVQTAHLPAPTDIEYTFFLLRRSFELDEPLRLRKDMVGEDAALGAPQGVNVEAAPPHAQQKPVSRLRRGLRRVKEDSIKFKDVLAKLPKAAVDEDDSDDEDGNAPLNTDELTFACRYNGSKGVLKVDQSGLEFRRGMAGIGPTNAVRFDLADIVGLKKASEQGVSTVTTGWEHLIVEIRGHEAVAFKRVKQRDAAFIWLACCLAHTEGQKKWKLK